MRNKNLTPEQKEFIKANIGEMKFTVLADMIGLSVDTLRKKCQEAGILHGRKKITSTKPEEPPVVQVRPATPKPYKRPRPDHDNPSREDHVSRILNTKI